MHRLGEQLPFTIRKTMRRTDTRSMISTLPCNLRLILASILRRTVLAPIACDTLSPQPPPIAASRQAGRGIPGNSITREGWIRISP
jgi:hypothetical protein